MKVSGCCKPVWLSLGLLKRLEPATSVDWYSRFARSLYVACQPPQQAEHFLEHGRV